MNSKILLYFGAITTFLGPPTIATGFVFLGQLAMGFANVSLAIYNITIKERIQATTYSYCSVCYFLGVFRYLYYGLDLLT